MVCPVQFVAFVCLPILGVVAPAHHEPAGVAPYPGYLAELRGSDAVVAMKVNEATPMSHDLKTNSVLSWVVRGEVTDVLKGDVEVGDEVAMFAVGAALASARSHEGHLYFGGVPQVGETGTFLLRRGRPWRASNVLTTTVDLKYTRAYVKAAEAEGAEAALRLAELFCETSFETLRDRGPNYGFRRVLVEDLRPFVRDLDPAGEPFRRRVVERYAAAALEQCSRPTLLTNTEGWDAVVWLASCMDDRGRREAVRRLVTAHAASVERVRRLPPAPPRRPPGRDDPRACASAPDPRDQEAILQSFLLSAIELVMDPGWREGPPGKATGHLVPHEKLLDQELNAEEVIPRARGFGVGVG